MKYYSLKTENQTADLTIFGDITSMKMLENDVSSYTIQQELSNADVDSINVHINSYGGEVAEALAIYNTLKRHRASVTTYVDGFACSAATIVFMAGDTRVMSSVGNFLVHSAWAGVVGNADDLRREADNLDAITEQSINAYMEHVTKTREELIELMREEKFLTPDEVLEWGFANVVEEAEDTDRPAASVREMVHKILIKEDEGMNEVDLDALNETIEEPKSELDELSEQINEDETEEEAEEADETEESDTEIDIEVDESEEEESDEESETDEESADEETDEESDEDEKPENREAGMMACFLKAFE